MVNLSGGGGRVGPDTAHLSGYAALGVYNDGRVLDRVGEIFRGETNVRFSRLRVGETDCSDWAIDPVLRERFNLYLLPMDYMLPGGMQALDGKLAGNSRIVFVTDKPLPEPNPVKLLTQTEPGILVYGYVRTPQLFNDHGAEVFKQNMIRVLNHKAYSVLMLIPGGFEKAKERIERSLAIEGSKPAPKPAEANSLDETLRMLDKDKFDRVYLPESVRPELERVKNASLEQSPWYLFFTRDNGILLFE